MWKKIFVFFAIAGICFAANPNKNKRLILKKINGKIRIDGIIDEQWSSADSVSDFVEFQPYPNTIPSRRTVAKVLSSRTSLYCLIECYDDPSKIQLNSGMLDDRVGDFTSIMLDTFGDKRTAYKFAVSATGVKSDSRLLDDARKRDYGWDGIWFASTKIYKWGYAVEIEIPYKSIQYNDSLNVWGLDFDRFIPRLQEDIYWCSYPENEGLRVSKFGKLIFDGFKPEVHGLNLEIYPVGIVKAVYNDNGKYNFKSNAGLDIFYNPSPQLTFQFTANPDFAQVEADPYNFNISRYETYYSEQRPFFTEGKEVFEASGGQRNMGFYRPLELFYSRRIGKKLSDGTNVPLLVGSKAFGRLGSWEYGGFFALTGEKEYWEDGEKKIEPRATFASVRLKKQVLGNSSVGALFVGKKDRFHNYGVLDIDGALRHSDWQLAYQVARSFKDSQGDFALSAGFSQLKSSWLNLGQVRYIGKKFDIEQIGYVPWIGSYNVTFVSGPRWVKKKGLVKSYMVYGGFGLDYTDEDAYADRFGIIGLNTQFRNMMGLDINLIAGKSKDLNVFYKPLTVQFSFWYFGHPDFQGNLHLNYSKTYNFGRDYLGSFYSAFAGLNWKPFNVLRFGTSLSVYVENKPDGSVEDIAYNARPYFSFIPINNLSLRVYVDNLFLRSTHKLERSVIGFLFSYNFSPKSWIYFAINDDKERSEEYDINGNLLPLRLHTVARAAVFKVKYLYYF